MGKNFEFIFSYQDGLLRHLHGQLASLVLCRTGSFHADITACTVDKVQPLKCHVFILISDLLNSYFTNGLPQHTQTLPRPGPGLGYATGPVPPNSDTSLKSSIQFGDIKAFYLYQTLTIQQDKVEYYTLLRIRMHIQPQWRTSSISSQACGLMTDIATLNFPV